MSTFRKATHRFTLDVNELEIQKSISITKGDVNRQFIITLQDGGKPFPMDKRWSAALVGIKPDNTTLHNSCVIENKQIIYDFESGPEISTCEGAFEIRFEILDEYGRPLASPAIMLNVINFTGRDVASSNESTLLSEIYEKINKVQEDLEETNERIEIEVFDLSALGLPDIPVGGEAVHKNADCTEIVKALRNNTARFSAYITYLGIRLHGEMTATNINTNATQNINSTAETYICCCNFSIGEVIFLVSLTVDNDGVSATAFRLQSYAEGRIETLEKNVGDLMYEQNPFSIVEFKNNVGTVEIGSVVEEVKLSWKFSRPPETVSVNGVELEPAESGEYTPEDGKSLALDAPGKKEWKLTATHEREDNEKEATSSVVFANRVWYGSAKKPETYNSEFVKSLSNKPLRTSKMTSIRATAAQDEYIYYCQPTRLGTCVFSFGANEGGVSLVDTIEVTNDSNYSERYYIYRSDQAGLGDTTLGVK